MLLYCLSCYRSLLSSYRLTCYGIVFLILVLTVVGTLTETPRQHVFIRDNEKANGWGGGVKLTFDLPWLSLSLSIVLSSYGMLSYGMVSWSIAFLILVLTIVCYRSPSCFLSFSWLSWRILWYRASYPWLPYRGLDYRVSYPWLPRRIVVLTVAILVLDFSLFSWFFGYRIASFCLIWGVGLGENLVKTGLDFAWFFCFFADRTVDLALSEV